MAGPSKIMKKCSNFWAENSAFLARASLPVRAGIAITIVGFGLAACTQIPFGPGAATGVAVNEVSLSGQSTQIAGTALGTAKGETLGTGPMRISLLVPLTGPLSNIGISMRNAAQMAVDQTTAQGANNIQIIVKDSAGEPATASVAAGEALAEGAKLILGPLRGASVSAAGQVARASGVPVIAFSNNSGVASPGVYLLNVLPEIEARRVLEYASRQGRRSFAAVLPNNAYGRVMEAAFRGAISSLGLTNSAIRTFSNEDEARTAIAELVPFIQSGQIDTVFIPESSTASSMGVLLETSQIPVNSISILGSSNWDGVDSITQTAFLTGAVYPLPDPAGFKALSARYSAKFGIAPHPISTFVYTAVLLANQRSLAGGVPAYSEQLLTQRDGFSGQDGIFRFLPNGTSEQSLVIMQVSPGGNRVIEAAKIISQR